MRDESDHFPFLIQEAITERAINIPQSNTVLVEKFKWKNHFNDAFLDILIEISHKL